MFPTPLIARFSNRDGLAVIRSHVASSAASNGKPKIRSRSPPIGVPLADMSSSIHGLPNEALKLSTAGSTDVIVRPHKNLGGRIPTEFAITRACWVARLWLASWAAS